jgi:hypothetical protein
MKVSGPEHHRLTFDATKCNARFSGLATNTFPKLYVVAVSGELIYVGVTKRKMSARFGAAGWNPNGRNGYHGYSWRHKHREADLYVWSHDDAPNRSSLDMETVEAEVAFLIRRAGQWPSGQTEIHFHPSEQMHRKLAELIVQYVCGTADHEQV